MTDEPYQTEEWFADRAKEQSQQAETGEKDATRETHFLMTDTKAYQFSSTKDSETAKKMLEDVIQQETASLRAKLESAQKVADNLGEMARDRADQLLAAESRIAELEFISSDHTISLGIIEEQKQRIADLESERTGILLERNNLMASLAFTEQEAKENYRTGFLECQRQAVEAADAWHPMASAMRQAIAQLKPEDK